MAVSMLSPTPVHVLTLAQTGGAALSDMWTPEQRGQAIAIYSLAPLLGPVIGPVAGGWIAERSTWRWVFWSTSIVAMFIQVMGLIFLKESKWRGIVA